MKKKAYSFLYLLPITFYLSQGFAQPIASPDVKCVSVAANGDVTLTWITPTNTGTFVDYKIYASPNTPTAFAPVGTVTVFAQPTFFHPGAGANTKRIYYYVQTEYSNPAGTSASIDTCSTIYLQVANPNTGYAQLSWNAVTSPLLSTSSTWYKIYLKRSSGVWSLHDSIQTNSQNITYTDKFHTCADTLSYRIEIADNSGCSSVSNIWKGKIDDGTSPIIEPIDTVSVNAANLATISWYPSPSPDADSVEIYRATSASGPWFSIAIVPVPQTSFTYTASVAGTMSEYYCIAFIDSCKNLSAQGTPHRTIYLSSSFNPCAGTANLSWNSYINMNVPVKQYEVLRSVNAGAFNMITTLPSTDTTYLDTGLVIGTAYCYIIRATNLAGKTSSSNKICLTPSVVNPPAFTYNRFATVQSNNSILITGYVDPTPSVSYYYLKRAAGSSGVFSNSFIVPKPTGNTITYTDKTVNTQAESYSYKWEAINTCNKAIMTSNTDTTILLKATVALNLGISLTWNNYGSWLGGVDHYEVYRAVDGVWDPSPVGIVPYSSTEGTYTDDVTSVCATSEGKFSYYVVAIEGNGNPYSFKDSSKSNVVTLYEYPKVYAPNAFTPNGDKLNDIFIPIICFINPGAYSLSIYDRWGYPIMQSTNPAEGWDGKKKGHPCEEGIYMYVINCTASNGDNSLVSGTITLIR